MATKKHTPEQEAHIALVLKHLQVGDVITHTRCMGLIEEHKFSGTEGYWLCGHATQDTRDIERRHKKRGHGTTGWTNDISPLNVTHINRVPVNCIELLAN